MRKLLICFILLLGAISAAQAGYPLRVKDARGKLVTINARPERIVSIAPNMTEILFAVGAGGRVVGDTKYCYYPPEAKKLPKIGDMIASPEAVIALRPDLVFAHAVLNDKAITQLEKLGLKVFAIDPKTISQVIRDLRTVGLIVGRPGTANTITARMEREIASVKASRAKKPRRNLLVSVQANPLWVAGPHTFVDEMLTIANARNVARDARTGFVTFSKELAITRSPDVIIVGEKISRDYFLKSAEWKDTNAVKTKRVYVVNNDLLIRPGPRLVIGLRELAKRLDY